MESSNGTPDTLLAAVRYFDAETARRYVAAIKWGGEPCCPTCGSVNVGTIASRGRFQCRERGCRRQFSLTTGTILEATHLRVDQWIVGVWMIANCRNGVSSCEIARAIGCKQQSAWHLLHRVRYILKAHNTEMMSGTVEADATFVGGLAKYMNRATRRRAGDRRGHNGKTVVHAMLCRDTGKVRASVIENQERKATERLVRENVQPGSYLFTDNGSEYRWARYSPDYSHHWVNHLYEYVRGTVHTNGLENFFNCLRRGLKGTYIAATPEHLEAYVDEQAFRFNHRKETDWQRFDRAMRMIVGKRLTYSALTDGAVR